MARPAHGGDAGMVDAVIRAATVDHDHCGRRLAVHGLVDLRAHTHSCDLSSTDGGLSGHRRIDARAGRRLSRLTADYSVDGGISAVPGHGEHRGTSSGGADCGQSRGWAATASAGTGVHAGRRAPQHVDLQYRLSADADASRFGGAGVLLGPGSTGRTAVTGSGLVLQHRGFGNAHRHATQPHFYAGLCRKYRPDDQLQ